MSTPTVVMIGLPYNHPQIPVDFQEKIRAGLQQAEQSIASLPFPVKYEFLPTSPEDSLDILKQNLIDHQVDAVIIGNGIRSNMGLTPWFEKIINTAIEARPGVRILFNTTPDNTSDAVARWFGPSA
ncbi:hypothetical protein HDV00_002204 [Rhizophlyctis rosea]|nr:hypothetical protein HDV00_002204 [Rhizophlyctis rosea]